MSSTKAPSTRSIAPAAPPRKRVSPRKRARRLRLVQYAVLLLLVLGGAMTANWHQIGQAFFRLDMIEVTLTNGLGRAMLNTVVYALGAFVGGAVFGTILALMRLSPVAPYRWLATIYIEFFRGLPAIIVLLAFSLIGLVIPGLTIPGGLTGSVWLGLGIVAAAYLAETIRAGILAVPKGQIEAARSLGMPAGMATRKIVLPQAFRIILPPMTNELILLIKDSSLVFVIGLTREAYELTKYGRDFAATYSNLTPLVFAGLCYLVITLPLTFVVRRLESKSSKGR